MALLPPNTSYTELIRPLSQACPQILSADYEGSVSDVCPVPRSHGLLANPMAVECGFLLVLPRCVPNAMRWLHMLTQLREDTPLCILLRSKEYERVDIAFAQRLFERTASARKLAEVTSKGRLVGMQLAGSNCTTELTRHAATWNREAGGGAMSVAVYAALSVSESAHMSQVFFELQDSGNSME